MARECPVCGYEGLSTRVTDNDRGDFFEVTRCIYCGYEANRRPLDPEEYDEDEEQDQ